METGIETYACPHCGQLISGRMLRGETPDEAAERLCSCSDAKLARERRRRRNESRRLINELFGEECREAWAVDPLPEGAVGILMNGAEAIIEGKIGGMTIDIPRVCKATIKKGGKGEVRVKRTQSSTIEKKEST